MAPNPTDNGNRTYLPYMKLWADEWLTSSIHYNCTLEEQGFFVALMALAAKNRKERGCLSLEVGQPMPIQVIASALYISVDTCQRNIDKMIKQDRVRKRSDGVLYIANFDYYQNKYRRSSEKTKPSSEGQEQRERGYLHHLQGKYPDEIKKDTKAVYVDKETGQILSGGKDDA